MKTLRDALLEYPPQMLRAIADMNALQLPEGGSRDQWADFLSNELARADIAQQAWQSLGEAERGIIERMRQNDGRIKAFQLLRDHGEIRPFGVVALARDKPWLSPANSVESLWYRGLIQRAFDVGGAYRGEVFFIPQEILAHWPRAGAGEVHFAIKTVPAPQAILDDDDAAVWDMFTFLSFVVREEPVSADGDMLRPDDLLTLHAQFLVKDDFQDKRAASAAPRLSFIQRIARTARLVKSNDGRGLRAGLRATDWLRAPRHQQRMQLVEAWQRERLWNELAHVPTLRLEETGWKNDPRLARNVVWAQLAHCPTGAWISTASFVAAIKKADPDFQRPDGDYERWHIRDQATGRLLTGFSQWQNVEGALISYILHFPLRWLGVVNVSAKMDEQAEFSITEFGARALGRSAVNPPQPRAAKVIAQANFEVLVPLDAPLNARFQLERMAERVRWDRVSTYRLTRESVTRLLRRQVTIEQMIGFLKRASREPFPKNVEVTLREWADKYGEITLRQGAILHTRDRKLMRELQHHPQLKTYIIEVLSSTVALVQADKLEELQARLQSLGYSPRVEIEPPRP